MTMARWRWPGRTAWRRIARRSSGKVRIQGTVARLAIAREHVIGQGGQCLALAPGRKGGQAVLGSRGVLDGPVVGELRGAMLAHQTEDLAPLLGAHGPVAHDATYQAVGRLRATTQEEDDRQRHLAF